MLRNVIYKLTNIINNKCYIGLTSRDYLVRWKEHIDKLNSSEHDNKHLQRAWNKYGSENFIFEVIEVVENPYLLAQREIYWIDYFDSYYNGYNETLGGEGVTKYHVYMYRYEPSPSGANLILVNVYFNASECSEKNSMSSEIILQAIKGKYYANHIYRGFFFYDKLLTKKEKEENLYRYHSLLVKKHKNRSRRKNRKVIQKSLSGEILEIYNKVVDIVKKGYDLTSLYDALRDANNNGHKYRNYIWVYLD